MILQEKVDHISEKAKVLESYLRDESTLYEAVNNLTRESVQRLLNTYELDSTDNQTFMLGPVNIVRSRILKFLLESRKIDGDLINEIKNKFIMKDLAYFSEYPEHIKKGIQEYEIGLRGPFHVWRNDFRILYKFFFSLDDKIKVNQYLEDIKNEIFEAR